VQTEEEMVSVKKWRVAIKPCPTHADLGHALKLASPAIAVGMR
jgi:hypothetical protein